MMGRAAVVSYRAGASDSFKMQPGRKAKRCARVGGLAAYTVHSKCLLHQDIPYSELHNYFYYSSFFKYYFIV